MAKNSTEQAPSGGLATVLMVVAIVATVALLVWLGFASRPAEGPAVTLDAGLEVGAGPTAPSVTAAEFGANMASYVGQDVNLAGVTVSTVVNNELIQVGVGDKPFTVRLLPGATATPPVAQSVIDVEGRVLSLTDSVLDAWQQAGAITDTGMRSKLRSSGSFIEANAIRPSTGME